MTRGIDYRRWRMVRRDPAPLPTALETAQPLNRQSCDRDYNSRKEPADAEEHKNIVDFRHGAPL